MVVIGMGGGYGLSGLAEIFVVVRNVEFRFKIVS